MKNIYLIICIALVTMLCVGNLSAQTRAQNVKSPVITHTVASLQDAYPDQTRAPWDLLWAFNVDVVQGTTANFSPFLWGDKLYVTKWNVTNGVAHRFAKSGTTWVADGSITITGLTYGGINAEGFCTDGEFLYCCTGNNIIFKINPATWAATVQCTVLGGGVDCIAYDEDLDAFWIASYESTTARRVSRTGGAAQKTLTATLPIADLAWEKSSDGTPYLWMSACATPANLNLHRWNLNTDAFTLNAKTTTDIPNQSGGTGGAGLFTCLDMSVEKYVLIGLIEGDNDVAYCYELGDGGSGSDPCPAVTNVTATAQGKKVTVNWSAATGDVANYKIYQSTEVATVPAGTTTWTSGDLANGTYTFEVAATYADDCVPVKVAAAPVTVRSCDGVVSNLEVEYDTECTTATLTWDAPARSRAFADAYVLDTYQTGGYYSIILETGEKTPVGPKPTFLTDETATGEDFDGTTLYRITAFGRVFSVAENGDQTLIGTITGTSNCIGLAYDWKNQDGFYFVDITAANTVFNLYKLSIPSLEKTLIGTAGGTFRRGLALHEDGYLYSLTTSITPATPSDLIRVNPANGQITTVGTIGFPAMYGFELAYDRVEDVLYASPIHYSTTGAHVSKLISLNTTTGAATLIKDYGFLQHSTLSITKGDFVPVETKYNVYRDGVLIAGPITATTFVDETFNATQAHTWSVAVICSHGGDGEWVVVSAVGDCYGIKELYNKFAIHPNPATHDITITATKSFNTVEVLNFLGQTVKTQINVGNSATIDVSDLSNGIYFIRIVSETGTSVKKFVKQ